MLFLLRKVPKYEIMKKTLYDKIGAVTALVICTTTALLCFSGCALKPKVYRVGILSGLDLAFATAKGFMAKMAELGYREGKNIVYDVQKSNFSKASYEHILGKFVADKVDLIFVFPTEAALQAKAATRGTGIPVVFSNVFIEGSGLVNSVQEPGGNLTGVRWRGPDIALRTFEIMHELVPLAKRIWVIYQRGYPIVTSQIEMLHGVSKKTGVTLVEIPAGDIRELERELLKRSGSVRKGENAIITIAEPLVASHAGQALVLAFAGEHAIPVGGSLVTGGNYETVFGMIPRNDAQGRQAAVLADKILKGMPPGKIPVVSADEFFQLNYRAAEKLGIKVGEGLLSRADTIIR